MFAFVVFVSVFLLLSQEIGWEERLRNDLFCVEWDVKPQLNQSFSLWCLQAVINSVGGIRTLFLLLEQAVSRRVDLNVASGKMHSEFDLQFAPGNSVY